MYPFKAPVDDILHSLTKVAGADRLDGWDHDLARDVIGHFSGFAEGRIAPINAVGDLEGCRLHNGSVLMPSGFRDVYGELAAGGWQGLTAPENFGGMGQSPVLAGAVWEIFSGANHSMQMVCNLVPGAISTLLHYGDQDQQRAWIPRLASGEALSTMCITEPSAGSDLSGIRTKAVQSGNNWSITGEKIFISGGDQDLSDDILHLVLARSGALDDGVRGLSLFLCSKSEAGSAIRVSRIEEKMGLHASPTCHMIFDGAPAQLIGEEGAGLAAMFTVMNHARIDVALQGVAHAARAHAIAKACAEERSQGRTPDGAPAKLSDHADVQRMLHEQRKLTMSARAMAHIALVEIEKGVRPELAEFLTPLCKIYCSEAGIRSADLGIQVLGGYGYLTEYGMSQTWRDARITSIYEGANGIHRLTLATRGLRVNGGAAADAFEALVLELAPKAEISEPLAQWQHSRKTVLKADDPSQHAFDFSELSAGLLETALGCKMGFNSAWQARSGHLWALSTAPTIT